MQAEVVGEEVGEAPPDEGDPPFAVRQPLHRTLDVVRRQLGEGATDRLREHRRGARQEPCPTDPAGFAVTPARVGCRAGRVQGQRGGVALLQSGSAVSFTNLTTHLYVR
ncbi:hypothetical protein [Kitasatospora sp. KL5]|uniref:hypothetical protein n=1 Tax=Kitasatospora sp. KL5 TaxID=3425125 RepID=UPI003D6DADE7